MKMKSTLWALAFACAAVSCSDDFEDPNKGGNGNGANGETAQMKVFINTEAITKASTSAEEGDGDELGSEEESTIKDLTVFLFGDGDGQTGNGITFTKNSPIVAVGFSSDPEENKTDHPNKHGWEAEVEVTLTEATNAQGEKYTLAGNEFGVLTVTNAGDMQSSFSGNKTVGDLADHVLTEMFKDQKFLMSTHILDETNYGGADHKSYIKFPAANETQTIPTTEVYVERLAAKIRINDNNNEDFIFTPTTAQNDEVRLNQVAIMNQLSSGSYLLKRVNTITDADLAEELALTSDAANDVLLGDEKYTVAEKANFVIDPWTRAKAYGTVFAADAPVWPVGAGTITVPLAYSNGLYKIESGVKQNYAAWFTALPTEGVATAYTDAAQLPARTLNGNTAITATEPLTLAYTRENVTNVENSRHGFSTGAIFKATYYAQEVMKIQTETGQGQNKSVKMAKTAWGNATTDEAKAQVAAEHLSFYTYGINEVKFGSLLDIFAYTLAEQSAGQVATDCYFYDSFMDTKFATLKVADYKLSKTYNGGVDDPFGYMAYLKAAVDKVNLETNPDQTMSGADIQTIAGYLEDTQNASKLYTKVKSYVGGECYYLYWIRHENNNKQNSMGPMEFAIVRNNIYDMTVTGINGLGESGIDVPDPKKPDEDKTVKMNVTVKVKNWVVRTNGNIIL